MKTNNFYQSAQKLITVVGFLALLSGCGKKENVDGAFVSSEFLTCVDQSRTNQIKFSDVVGDLGNGDTLEMRVYNSTPGVSSGYSADAMIKFVDPNTLSILNSGGFGFGGSIANTNPLLTCMRSVSFSSISSSGALSFSLQGSGNYGAVTITSKSCANGYPLNINVNQDLQGCMSATVNGVTFDITAAVSN